MTWVQWVARNAKSVLVAAAWVAQNAKSVLVAATWVAQNAKSVLVATTWVAQNAKICTCCCHMGCPRCLTLYLLLPQAARGAAAAATEDLAGAGRESRQAERQAAGQPSGPRNSRTGNARWPGSARNTSKVWERCLERTCIGD